MINRRPDRNKRKPKIARNTKKLINSWKPICSRTANLRTMKWMISLCASDSRASDGFASIQINRRKCARAVNLSRRVNDLQKNVRTHYTCEIITREYQPRIIVFDERERIDEIWIDDICRSISAYIPHAHNTHQRRSLSLAFCRSTYDANDRRMAVLCGHFARFKSGILHKSSNEIIDTETESLTPRELIQQFATIKYNFIIMVIVICKS